MPIFAWSVRLVSLIFLKRSQSFQFYCFLLFLCIDHLGILYLSAFLWNSAFRWIYLSFSPLPFASLLFSAIWKASSDNHFAFLHFFFLGMVLITASCIMSGTSVHSSLGTLSDLIPWIYFSLPLYNCKGFYLYHYKWSSGFPYFLWFKSEFGYKVLLIWATVSSGSCFCSLYRASPPLAVKNIINLILVLTIWWCLCVGSSLVLL